MDNKRFTFKWLGVFMEIANYNPKETRKTIWSLVMAIAFLIVVWRLPEILMVFVK
ncbi:photosystem I reaction center subunit PsaK [Mannheimia pernigra]|nr:photosystem I reaction center subunit PsaK [Mannheimia pernigra]QLB44466.1 photosystem I reaction center subunit PsaK [Mannheimia pernigra]